MMVSYMYKRKFSEYLIELKVAMHDIQSASSLLLGSEFEELTVSFSG